LQLSDGGLDSFVFESKTLNGDDLVAVTRRVKVGAEADVVLESLCAQVDDSLVELVLSMLLEWTRYKGKVSTHSLPDVVSDKDSTINLRKGRARRFSVEIRYNFFLGGLLKGYAFEMKVGLGWPL
jgi:hypothetical protein